MGYYSVPLCFDRSASKNIEQEDTERPNGYDNHTNLENPYVSSLNRNTEEEDCNAQFDEHDINDVEHGCECLVLSLRLDCCPFEELKDLLFEPAFSDR